jgi:hypothetical protein
LPHGAYHARRELVGHLACLDNAHGRSLVALRMKIGCEPLKPLNAVGNLDASYVD